MTNELATYEPGSLTEEMSYARAVSVANMLPDNYRGKPADIMLAVGLGRSMGLSPAESLYRISVIKGKPTASAELIAANVRKAGHRLRVRGDETTATATIIRADDPDYEFTVTRDLEWAKRMGLAGNDNYKKQSGTMLQWRAITACARLACPEALYGVTYTPDELEDAPRVTATQEQPASRVADLIADEPVEGEVVKAAIKSQPDLDYDSSDPLLNTSSNLAKRMYATIGQAGIAEDQRIPFLSAAVGRQLGSSKEMTEAEAREVLDNFDALLRDWMGADDALPEVDA